jgi:hypothetical protein
MSGLIGVPLVLSLGSCALSLLLCSSSGNTARVKFMMMEGKAGARAEGAEARDGARHVRRKRVRIVTYLRWLAGKQLDAPNQSRR